VAAAGELDGVADQVEQHVEQPVRVGYHLERRGGFVDAGDGEGTCAGQKGGLAYLQTSDSLEIRV